MDRRTFLGLMATLTLADALPDVSDELPGEVQNIDCSRSFTENKSIPKPINEYDA